MREKEIAQKLLKKAGVEINGDRPCDIQVHNEGLYARVLKDGSLGLGEAYLDGWWDAESLDNFFAKVLRAHLDKDITFNFTDSLMYLKVVFLNLQSKLRSQKVAKEHYDLSYQLYESFLDPYNQYTCGYFKDINDLNLAQEQKLDLICRKLQLKPGDRVLDIGCGWGGFANYAAKNFGCHITGVTISEEQYKYAKKFCQDLPVEILKKDYRDLQGKFDKILVCGMIEHVGMKNYSGFMRKVESLLDKKGLFLLHTIGGNESKIAPDAWMNKYIFPGGMLPSMKRLTRATEGVLVMEDWHNFGQDYDLTLMAWYRNFEKNWSKIKENYDQRFYRMWKYYLLSSAGAFRARDMQLWQIVFSKNGVSGGYTCVR